MNLHLKPAFRIATLAALAAASVNAVTVAWNVNPEPNIAGYRLYYGALNAPATQFDVGRTNAVSLTNLTPGESVFFYVTAYNTAGLESVASSQIVFNVPSPSGAVDSDGDGFSDLEESQMGTNPMDSASGLRITATTNETAGFSLNFVAVTGTNYVVEANDDFPSGVWQAVSGNVQGGVFTDAGAAPLAKRIYRVRPTAGAAISEYVGFQRFSFGGSADNMFSLPFTRPVEARGVVAAVSGETVQIQGNLPWVPNRWAYSSGVQSNTYFLYIRTGAGKGVYHTITANGTDTLTLDLDGGSLAGVAAGDLVAVIPYWTLGTIFPNGAGVHASPSSATRSTEVYVPDLGAVGVNAGTWATYYFRNGTWRQVGQGSVVKNDDVILPDMFVFVRNNIAVSTELTAHGCVLEGELAIPIRRNLVGTQDNIMALPRPHAVSLNASGLIESGAFRASLSAATRTDEIYIFAGGSVVGTYYYRSGSWRKVGAGSTDMGEEKVFVPGGGFIIRASSGSVSDLWVNEAGY